MECDYGMARNEMAAEHYDEAIEILERLGAYEDAEAVAIFQELPDDGNAQFDLGLCYASGYGVEQDLGQAVEWFEKAAGQDCADAQYILGKYYYDGSALEQDYAKAFEMFTQAAELGNAQAQCELAWMYLERRCPEPEGGEPELSDMSAAEFNSLAWYALDERDVKAFEWFEKAAEQGYAEAQYLTGTLYSGAGRGVKGDSAKAVEWYKKAADQGYVYAQFNLGSCYYNGDGVEQDYGKAFEMLMKAAEQGLANAQLAVARCYLRGEGVKQNDAKANEWIDKAVEQGMDIDDIIAMYQ